MTVLLFLSQRDMAVVLVRCCDKRMLVSDFLLANFHGFFIFNQSLLIPIIKINQHTYLQNKGKKKDYS